VIARDLLEHLEDFMAAMEELHRIVRPGGIVRVKVPYRNSWCRNADPTHQRGFHELMFQFFDPSSHYLRERHYYSKACFEIVEVAFVLSPFTPYLGIPGLTNVRVRKSSASASRGRSATRSRIHPRARSRSAEAGLTRSENHASARYHECVQ
jgi:hypothetical protein